VTGFCEHGDDSSVSGAVELGAESLRVFFAVKHNALII
jgi:hypothetical protein